LISNSKPNASHIVAKTGIKIKIIAIKIGNNNAFIKKQGKNADITIIKSAFLIICIGLLFLIYIF